MGHMALRNLGPPKNIRTVSTKQIILHTREYEEKWMDVVHKSRWIERTQQGERRRDIGTNTITVLQISARKKQISTTNSDGTKKKKLQNNRNRKKIHKRNRDGIYRRDDDDGGRTRPPGMEI